MHAHDAPLRIVQGQPHLVEADHTMQALGELVKELSQVAVGGDGLRHLQQGAVVLLGESFTSLLSVVTQAADQHIAIAFFAVR
ncbi:MAG: hypothetical protein M3461_21165 [Pseudomonadota bacterium]|nr:hypothetical protein [Pseudomonadota bacterium]